MTGLQMMLNSLLKNLPPEITETILQIGKDVVAFKAQLDRIEAQNRQILNALEQHHEATDGSGPCIGSGVVVIGNQLDQGIHTRTSE